VRPRAKVTIDSLQEVVYEKSIDTKMNDLDLCLEVVSRSCQALRYIRRGISRKPLEIEAWFQRTTNRKWHMDYQMVTWPDNVTWLLKVLWGSTVGYPSDSLASCHTWPRWRRDIAVAFWAVAERWKISLEPSRIGRSLQWKILSNLITWRPRFCGGQQLIQLPWRGE